MTKKYKDNQRQSSKEYFGIINNKIKQFFTYLNIKEMDRIRSFRPKKNLLTLKLNKMANFEHFLKL